MVLKMLLCAGLFFTVVYVGFGVILYLLQSKFLYCPIKHVTYTPQDIDLKYEDISLVSGNGTKINAWYIPAVNAKDTLLFCHGNGGNIMHRLDSIQQFNELGLNCLIFDYQGYGKSEGKPNEQGTYDDARAAYDWLVDNKKLSSDNIIIFGRSLGGSIAAKLAAEVDCAGLVLESSFTSYLDMAKSCYPYMPVKFFVKYKYKTIEHLASVTCPLLVIHSLEDDVVPYKFGRELYESANEPKEFVEISGGHNDGFITSGQVYKTAWQNWLDWLKEKRQIKEQQAS